MQTLAPGAFPDITPRRAPGAKGKKAEEAELFGPQGIATKKGEVPNAAHLLHSPKE